MAVTIGVSFSCLILALFICSSSLTSDLKNIKKELTLIRKSLEKEENEE